MYTDSAEGPAPLPPFPDAHTPPPHRAFLKSETRTRCFPRAEFQAVALCRARQHPGGDAAQPS